MRLITRDIHTAHGCVWDFFLSFIGAHAAQCDYNALILSLAAIGLFSGVFGLCTRYLPLLFPTMLRTTGAGFCYNIGRIAAALGTVFFGLFSQVGDFRIDGLHFGGSWLLVP